MAANMRVAANIMLPMSEGSLNAMATSINATPMPKNTVTQPIM